MAYWYRRVFLLAIPLIFSNLTQPLLSTVDTVLSGHLPHAAALGGVAVGGIMDGGSRNHAGHAAAAHRAAVWRASPGVLKTSPEGPVYPWQRRLEIPCATRHSSFFLPWRRRSSLLRAWRRSRSWAARMWAN